MINLLTVITVVNAKKLAAAAYIIFNLIISKIKSKENGLKENSIDKQYHKRIAILKLSRLRPLNNISEQDLQIIYEISQGVEYDKAEDTELYHKLTGSDPEWAEDVSGLRVVFKEFLCILWSEGVVTLPYTFNITHAWKKNPEFEEKYTYGFIWEVAKGVSSLERASRSWQYRTNWHSPEDVDFNELWSAVPAMVDIYGSTKKHGKFALFSWVNRFSTLHPEIVSPDQAFYLERYRMYLAAKRTHEGDASRYTKTYLEYVKYYVMTPEEANSLPTHDMKLRRYKIRNINRQYARPSPKAIENRREQKIKQRAEQLLSEAGGAVTEDGSLLDTLSMAVSAEDYMLLVEFPKRNANLDWISNTFYPGRQKIEIMEHYSQWIQMGNTFFTKLQKSKRKSQSYIDAQVNDFRFLLDYVFCYLPLWKEQHPDSSIILPERIEDFERILYWCDDLIDEETVEAISKLKVHNDSFEVPLTALQLRNTLRTQKSNKPFINAVHLFFETVRTYGPSYDIVDGKYSNPVNIKMDSTGSGNRSKSNKIPFPREAAIIAKAYMHTLDSIGVQLRTMIIDGRISVENAATIKRSDWIDLSELGITALVTIQRSTNPTENLEIPIDSIPNIYHWWYGDYFVPEAEYKEMITSYVPWLSSLRMLAIALFAGQRLQNGQWLDLRTFDKGFESSKIDEFNLCMLHINTDKSGSSRDVVIDGHVMESLFDERRFQTDIYRIPPGLVYYENDPRDPQGYGQICPLFRSPWGGNDLPFADTTYSNEWIRFCKGLEGLYNSVVSPDSFHSFITPGRTGEDLAVHVPHALRATWITHMRIYGHLEVTIAARQAGHRSGNMSDYYTILPAEELLENINIANNIVTESAYKALMGKIKSPTSPGSAIVEGWSQDKQQLIRDQNFLSKQFYFINSQETGLDLMVKTETVPLFMTHCICMRNGDCPMKLVEFTRRARTCSLCDGSVWGVDHLPGINVCMRQAQRKSEKLIEKILQLSSTDLPAAELEPYHSDLTITRYELASYTRLADQLNTFLESENSNPGYISRYRDLAGAKRHAVDMANPRHRIIAEILDSEAYPHLTSVNYTAVVEKIAKSPELLSAEYPQPSYFRLLANQIASILKATNCTFDETFDLIAESIRKLGGK
ncbi:site-specific integrase [Pseudomonas syringae]|uniref:site-specific integrase n=1 Tax=Pseudomonas syringae TaxID=317 RepID=UPI0002E6E7D3|nr:site-specific integrase [Pseudomonas syringae]EPM91502.1 hypothetical protein A259_38726 [Pseudomonas syringae pv. actinidiae ICMP 19070]AQL36282.1 hypothetical protein JN853_07310 [Pseudomonas syringae pv. actinidiae ICMP 9853]EPM54833.1 hypothetical protein A256_09155 [Pseudomonas syringae pv. actinidiae ICMP 19103]EPM97351.1 hypothetical protein A258_09407 [Pseudomonas syringae pv. actinidiae ICMP 19104]EPN04996.1 hypothetical protein A253_08945 [Pseudomonas syringae pv. actinidiae ICMP 